MLVASTSLGSSPPRSPSWAAAGFPMPNIWAALSPRVDTVVDEGNDVLDESTPTCGWQENHAELKTARMRGASLSVGGTTRSQSQIGQTYSECELSRSEVEPPNSQRSSTDLANTIGGPSYADNPAMQAPRRGYSLSCLLKAWPIPRSWTGIRESAF
jgi:hypothetical protein